MNQSGRWFDERLTPGVFKTFPNSSTRPDGVVHQCCPPEQVDSELDNVPSWYGEYSVQPNAHPHWWWQPS